jgi:diguanylate cyclase (GGDEF)-like protein
MTNSKKQQQRLNSISALKDENTQLKKLAAYDTLTKLPNRLQFETAIARDLIQAEQRGRLLCLLFLDLDRFKKVNDEFGHATGDLLLIEAAKRFCRVLRKEDFVARLGGDEFAIILTNIKNIHQAELVANRIIATINKPFHLARHEVSVGISIGIALYPNSGDDWRNLVKDADIAMYRAKQEGRNIFRYVTSPTVQSNQLKQKNITLLKKIQKQDLKLAHILSHDLLTKLPNRSELEKVLKRSVASAKKHNRLLALLFLDLDNFKSINDSLGYDIGNLLLKEVAKRLSSSVDSNNFVARLGGDEFAVIIAKIKTMNDAGAIADKIRAKILEAYNINGQEVYISASIGIAGYPESGDAWKDLLKNADIAVQRAKQAGQNTSRYMTTGDNALQLYQFMLEHKLRLALKNNELSLLYQPLVELKTGKMFGMEALLRCGKFSPSDFIPVAEKIGLICDIGEWVLKTSCEQYRKWFAGKRHQNNYLLSINVSARQLEQKKFLQTIEKILNQEKIYPQNISLELTETAIMQHEAEVKQVLEQLHKIGAKIAIDDFGIGYSSLSRLAHLPIHMLKIDQSFVKNIGIDISDEIIIKSTIALAHSLSLQILAEGVETEAQRKFLLKNGCKYAQGYYFSKPLTAKNMRQFIAKQNAK